MRKLLNIVGMSGCGKSTWSEGLTSKDLILPDTNKKSYVIYEEMLKKPTALIRKVGESKDLELMTSVHLLTTKVMADEAFMRFAPKEGVFIQMRNYFDYLVMDKLYMDRLLFPEDKIISYIDNLNSNFDEVEYYVFELTDPVRVQDHLDMYPNMESMFETVDGYFDQQYIYISMWEDFLNKNSIKYEKVIQNFSGITYDI